ncbi:MAG TPA: type IV pilus secretin PilQ, partial [bacterium]|nr:type IV pilus secretin PilQ [bacterium]
SSPRIATLDNKSAKISQGARIPFLSASAQGTQTNFIDATLELTVTPHITAEKSVFMTVSVRNNRPGAISVQGQPSIDIAEANTEILVKDGDTAVIGGVFVVNKNDTKTGLPGLMNLPLLGWLFRQSVHSEDRRELLVFMTPHIIAHPSVASK